MILLIDNYDSFSYNLYQMMGTMDKDITVIRNDELSIAQIAALKPERIIISPGPGTCEKAGICIQAVKTFGPTTPILGVCLGHQAICTAYGARVSYAKHLMHGKQSRVSVDPSCPIFTGLTSPLQVARYHSLAALADTIPPTLQVTATSDDGEVMAVMHRKYPVFGLQFHPESIMTNQGAVMLANFLSIDTKRGERT